MIDCDRKPTVVYCRECGRVAILKQRDFECSYCKCKEYKIHGYQVITKEN
jgi:Zn finger protein HypA/HybF involved in hydrogenase expression